MPRAVVLDLDHDLVALLVGVHAHAADRRLALVGALALALDAVVDGVAHRCTSGSAMSSAISLSTSVSAPRTMQLHALVLLARELAHDHAPACRTAAPAGPCALRARASCTTARWRSKLRCTRCASSTSSRVGRADADLVEQPADRVAHGAELADRRSSGDRACGSRRAPRWSASAARAGVLRARGFRSGAAARRPAAGRGGVTAAVDQRRLRCAGRPCADRSARACRPHRPAPLPASAARARSRSTTRARPRPSATAPSSAGTRRSRRAAARGA